MTGRKGIGTWRKTRRFNVENKQWAVFLPKDLFLAVELKRKKLRIERLDVVKNFLEWWVDFKWADFK